IKRQLWKSAFWTQSYCLIGTGGAPLEVVKKYIESQGRK
ncbi:UNVERIFIED_CONTAM: IS200/IS605 family transposase, partial [Limosilactobacillus fermentum]